MKHELKNHHVGAEIWVELLAKTEKNTGEKGKKW